MKGKIAVRKPVATVTLSLSSNNINTGAWTQILASLGFACSEFEIFNPSGSCLMIGIGAAGHEVALPITVLPGGTTGLVEAEISKGSRVSAQAVDANVTSGTFVMNFYG